MHPTDDRDDLTHVQDGRSASAPQPRFTVGELVAGRYRIVAELGRGGMGHVFRAEDTRLGQPVALKFLPALTAANADLVERLASEVRIGRAVSHPNVCRLYDIVDASDTLHFIAMEFVDGEDLASLLRRIGRIPADKAVNLAHDLCDGLAAAHNEGVIHRDLKPANIMIDSRGRARITDFGLAIALAAPRSREIAGTPAYMAPEQLRGEPANVRSDLYALGLVLFEMFTGRRLYDGKTADEIRAQHARAKPLPSSLVRDLPPQIDRVILECLEETASRRPASARDVGAILPAGDAAAAPRPRASGRETPRSGDRAERSIAVLPFEDVSGTGDDAFSAGLADEIISDLAKLRQLRVISRGSVMRYRGVADLTLVGRELQVGYVLTGSVRRSGDQLRLNANLVDTHTDEIVWSEKFRGSLSDIFDIQETVARTVAEQLRVHITAEESARIAERPISDPLAYEYYVRARNEIWKFTPQSLATAQELLRRATAITGPSAALLDAMAYAEWQFYNSGSDPDPAHLDRAEELAGQIAALDATNPSADRIRGLVAVSRGDLKKGAAALRQAMEVDPNDGDAAAWLTLCYAMAGRLELARPIAERLAKRDPFSIHSIMTRGVVYWYAADMHEGFALIDAARRLYPDVVPFEYVRAAFLVLNGRTDEAGAAFDAVAAQHETTFFGRLARLMSAAVKHDRDGVLRLLNDDIAVAARGDLQYSVEVAAALAAVGATEPAMEWLENGVNHGFFAYEFVGELCPMFVPVRDVPQFQELLRRMQRESAAFV